MTTPEDDDVARNQPKGSHQRGILYRSTPQSVPACTCSKHPLWDGYDGDCPIHGWFEPVAPDTPQSVPAWELVPCMDAWCKISPCKCRDGINALIAERDKFEALWNTSIEACGEHGETIKFLLAERDKLKEEVERLKTGWYDHVKRIDALMCQKDALVERVSVLEALLREAYEDAAKIAEEYAYGKGWSHTYIGELTAAIRARIKGN
jgi:hypothetical protein